MKKAQVKDIVTDNDGTMMSFHYWFSPAMLAVVPELANVMKVSVEELGCELGRNMVSQRTHETPFPFVGPYFKSKWKGTDAEFVERVSSPFFAAVDTYRKKYLHVYPGTAQTLDAAKALGIKLIVLSDAPLYASLHKFASLGWFNKFDGIYSLATDEPDASLIWNRADLDFGRSYVAKHLALSKDFVNCRVNGLPRSFEKPNAGGLDRIACHFDLKPKNTIVCGDSKVKDGGVAKKFGCRFVHARYGINDFVPLQYLEVINNLLNPNKGSDFNWHPATEEIPVFSEVLSYEGMIPLFKRSRRGKATAA